MVKQLGVPTFIMTLSSVDLRRNGLISIIIKLNKGDLSDEEIQKFSNHDWCKLLNNNPVLGCKTFSKSMLFQTFIENFFRIEVFFKEIIDGVPLEKVIYHAIWVEFHVRDSPHISCFRWVLNAPKENISFANKTVQAYYQRNPSIPRDYMI